MIYRTENGCGWGVKTKDPIKKGQFAVEYVGEVISNDEAEERGKKYGERERTKLIWWSLVSLSSQQIEQTFSDEEGRTYLFDLDFNSGANNPYTIDAAFYGNVSHFINHSCGKFPLSSGDAAYLKN